MERAVGGLLGLAGFAAVVLLSLAKGLALADCAWRAALAAFLGYLAGWLIFGKLGAAIAKEAAGIAAPATAEPKPAPKPEATGTAPSASAEKPAPPTKSS